MALKLASLLGNEFLVSSNCFWTAFSLERAQVQVWCFGQSNTLLHGDEKGTSRLDRASIEAMKLHLRSLYDHVDIGCNDRLNCIHLINKNWFCRKTLQ